MSPSNRNRTLSFVTFAALAALSGCGSEAASPEPSTLADRVAAAPIDGAHPALPEASPAETRIPVSTILRAPSVEPLHGFEAETRPAVPAPSVGPVLAPATFHAAPEQPPQWAATWASTTAFAPDGAGEIFVGSPAQRALSEPRVSVGAASQILATSPARLALGVPVAQPLRVEATSTLVVGTDACETDADCVPDGCHATSCVAAAEMAPGELECTAELRYGTTDGGGCLCHVGHCAARLSTPPQGI